MTEEDFSNGVPVSKTRSAVSDGLVRELRRVAGLVRRDWWVAILSLVVLSLLAVIFSLLQTPEYKSTASLYVTAGNDANAQSAYQGSLASQQRIASYARLVTTDGIIDQGLRDAGINKTVAEAKTSISATTSPDTVILYVNAKDPDPTVAANMANSVAESMVSYVSKLERPSAGGEPLAKLTVVNPAIPSASPVSPTTFRNTLLGGALGLVLGIAFILARDRLDTRVRTESDVLNVAASTVLGSVPRSDGAVVDGLADFSVGADAAAESYRRIRTNLSFVGVDSPARTILVTSTDAGDGKTTTALNLAAAIAEAGSRVLVVDGDLRRPSLAGRLGLAGGIGFTDLLRGRTLAEDSIQSSGYEGLDVLCSGAIPPNPGELLASQRAGDVLAELSKKYDYVFVDSPPMVPVSDASILSQWADGVILVVRSGATTAERLRDTVSQLSMIKAVLLGSVLNVVPTSGDAYRYSYYRTRSGPIDSERDRPEPAILDVDGGRSEAGPVR